MSKILGVNGIWNSFYSKDSFTDKILDGLVSYYGRNVVDVQYPRMWALLAYFDAAINRRAKAIVEASEPDGSSCVVAHSFGCLATVYAMRQGAQFDTVFFFGAAAPVDIILPEGKFRRIYNIHSDTDTTLFLGSLLPLHKFGNLGKTGYKGTQKNIFNVRADGNSHNSYVSDANLFHWLDFVASRLPASDFHPSPPSLLD